ncbi:MAG: tetratricopeptide repeat protein [Opitutus sp.]|nr:tetratricopeptide repeat protein [Opitutus sp.]
MFRSPREPQLALLVLALILITTANGQPAEAQRLYREAVALERGTVTREKLTDAIAKLKQAIVLHPGYIDAYVDVALCHRNLGQFDDAITACTEAVRLKPDSARALAVLASCHTALGGARPAQAKLHYDEAARIYREMVRIDPKDFGAYYRLANLLRLRGQRDEAIAACREAVRINPDFPEAQFELGECLWPAAALGTQPPAAAYAGSIAAFSEAIRLKRDNVAAYKALADGLTRAGQHDEAIAVYRKGIEACKNTAGRQGVGDLYLNLGQLYLNDGNRAAAEKVNEELKAADPKFPPLLIAAITRALAAAYPAGGMVMINESGGKTTERRLTASDDPKTLLQPGKNTLVILGDPATEAFNRALAAGAAGNRDAEIAAYRDAIRLKPDFPEAHQNLGNAYARLGRTDEALACYRECVRVKPDYAPGHYSLGLWLERNKQLPEALEAYREAVRLAPNHADMHQKLANIYLFLRRFDDAIASYKDCLIVDPRHAEGWMSLGMAYLYAGRRAEAIEAQAKLQPLDAGKASALQNLLDGKAQLGELK